MEGWPSGELAYSEDGWQSLVYGVRLENEKTVMSGFAGSNPAPSSTTYDYRHEFYHSDCDHEKGIRKCFW